MAHPINPVILVLSFITKTKKTLCTSVKGCAPAGRRRWWLMRCFASHRHHSFTRWSSFVGSWYWHKGKPRSFLSLKTACRSNYSHVMQGFYLFLYNKGIFVFSHPSTGVIRCADSLFPIEELLSILCTAGAILREAIFVMDRLCPVG